MPLMKVRREDDTGWYTVDHLNFNYIGLGINEPITLVQSNSKAKNLNKIYVYNGEYPYDINNPKEELLYKSSMLNELQNNWMPKLYVAYTGPIKENKQKDINITNVPGHPGALLLEHRTIIKNKTTQNNTGNTNTTEEKTPKCEAGKINNQGENANALNSYFYTSARTDYFNISTVKEIKPKNSIKYQIYVYDKNKKYEGLLCKKRTAANEYSVQLNPSYRDYIYEYDDDLKTDDWPKDKYYRLSGYSTSTTTDYNFWTFTIEKKVEESEKNENTTTIQETFHILNYWDDTNKKWIPLNNVWG